MRKRKNVDRTKYGDYSSSVLNHDEVKIHNFLFGIITLAAIVYCSFAIYKGELYIPSRHHNKGLVLHGLSMYLMLAAIFSMIISFLLPFLEYIRRKKDFHNRNVISKKYAKLKKFVNRVSWSLFIFAMIVLIITDAL